MTPSLTSILGSLRENIERFSTHLMKVPDSLVFADVLFIA